MSCILVGITGGIAAYKSAQLVSNLVKKGHDVEVLMTQHACEFITPLTLQTLSKHRVTVNSFDTNYAYDVHHISQAKKADAFVIAPASANCIAKIAHGIADDALTTTFLACTCPKIIAPAMNTGMLENPITQDNLQRCKDYGMTIVESESGVLACGDTGKGRLAELAFIEQAIEVALTKDKPFSGKRVLVNAGPTQESIDPVRFITNHSSGKMGVSIAKAFRNLGANVTLVLGPCHNYELYDINVIHVTSASDMAEVMFKEFDGSDIAIFTAAVADYTPSVVAEQKVKKSDDDLSISLKRTVDILSTCGQRKKDNQVIVGFAMETNNLQEYALKKCQSKNCDLVVANTINSSDEGFGSDTNRVELFTKEGSIGSSFGSKEDIAMLIATKVKELCY